MSTKAVNGGERGEIVIYEAPGGAQRLSLSGSRRRPSG
jgi:hypothetical protein